MTLVTESWVVDSLLSLTLVLFLLYCYLSHVYGYFRSRGIPYLTPVPLVGHIFLLTESQNSIARKLYNSFPAERFYGFFQSVVSIIKLFFNTHYNSSVKPNCFFFPLPVFITGLGPVQRTSKQSK